MSLNGVTIAGDRTVQSGYQWRYKELRLYVGVAILGAHVDGPRELFRVRLDVVHGVLHGSWVSQQ